MNFDVFRRVKYYGREVALSRRSAILCFRSQPEKVWGGSLRPLRGTEAVFSVFAFLVCLVIRARGWCKCSTIGYVDRVHELL